MVWGRPAGSGVDDLVKRLQANDPQLTSLTVLRFRRLKDEDVELLSGALQDNTVLQELICCSHAISSEAAARLGTMLQLNQQLQRISIGNSSFGDEALSALVCSGLRANKSLLAWDLELKGLSQASGASIAQVLQQHPTLQHVQLSRNTLTDAGLQQLCAGAWAKLTHLQLAACELTQQAVLSLASAPSIGQLQQLDLSQNPLGPKAGSGLAELLAKAKSLQQLQLRHTQLQDEGVSGVAEGLLQRTAGLPLLDLSSNALSGTGAAALAAALGRRPAGAAAVQQLVLADNPAVGDEAVCRLAHGLNGLQGTAAEQAAGAEELQQQQQLQQQLTLDLAHAGVGAGGVLALSKVSGLSRLSLFGCKLGGEQGCAVTALTDSITAGGFAPLEELNLAGCSLNLQQLGSVMAAVAAGSRHLPQLQTLELGANAGVQEEGFEEVVGQLRAARPGLDVHWRVADSDGAPPGVGQQ